MLFNSWGYILIFVVGASLLHWLLPHKSRKYLICIFNLFFYSFWNWEYSILIVFTSLLVFYTGMELEKPNPNKKRIYYFALITIISILAFFKYSSYLFFGNGSIMEVMGIGSININVSIIAPLGISFYTFQSLSYLFDVSRKDIRPVKNFFDFFSYSAFFPTIIAGPILKASENIEQFIKKRTINSEDLSFGIERIITGLFKKVVFADNISPYVNNAFSMNPAEYSSYDVWVMTFLFGFQLYFDFSGYSDIATGTARLMGFRIKDNFNWPFFASSPQKFWSRWHISLYNWLRSYIYDSISISLRNVKAMGIPVAVLITFLVCGIWHGSTMNFLVWGIFHGVLILMFAVFKPLSLLAKKLPAISWSFTYLLITMAWIPFRTENMQQCIVLWGKLFTFSSYNMQFQKLPAMGYYSLVLLFFSMCVLYLLKQLGKKFEPAYNKVDFIKVPVIAVMVFLIIIYLDPSNQFLYIQF